MNLNIKIPFKRDTFVYSVLFFCSAMVFSSCNKEESDLGLNIQPQEDQLTVVMDSVSDLITYSLESDSIRTDELTGSNLLGSYNDPYLGQVYASMYTQIRLEGAVDFTPDGGTLSDIAVDSVILYLHIDNFYGNLQEQTFEVYRLNEDMDIDENYYSNDTLECGASLVPIGMGNIVPDPLNDGTVAGESVDHSVLAIPLSINDFAMPIINESGNTSLGGNDGTGEFVEFFKGLHIKVNNPGQNANEGCILYIDLESDDSKVSLYYRDVLNEDTVQFDFNINSNSARFNVYKQDYTNSPAGALLQDSTLGSETFYLQTMGGLKPYIFLPNIETLNDTSEIIINKAVLRLPVQYYLSDTYLPAQNMAPRISTADGELDILPGNTETTSTFFDLANNYYEVDLTSYINSVLSGTTENRPITFIPLGFGVSANRTVFNGFNTSFKDRPKLIITFTQF